MPALSIDRPRRTVTDGPLNHWCPAEGSAWTCPDCGAAFTRISPRHAWRPAR